MTEIEIPERECFINLTLDLIVKNISKIIEGGGPIDAKALAEEIVDQIINNARRIEVFGTMSNVKLTASKPSLVLILPKDKGND